MLLYRRASSALLSIFMAMGFTLVPVAASLADADDGHESHASERLQGAENVGPHGGVLSATGEYGLELLLREEGEQPRLSVWMYRAGTAVAPAQATLVGRVERPNGAVESLSFVADGAGWRSEQVVAEPHFLRIAVQAKGAGQAQVAAAQLDRDEGLIALTEAQIAMAAIRTEAAGPAAIDTTTRFPGEIAFNADRTAHVVPRLDGVVRQVKVNLGQPVRKGQLLASISSTELADLRAQWQTAKQRLELSTATYEREKRLWQERVAAQQDYEQARAARQEAQIALRNAEQKLAAIGVAAQAQDSSLLEVRAPFDGVVIEKHVVLGEALTGNASIFTIADLGTVWAEFVVAPKDLQYVRVGEHARISSSAFDEVTQGQVSYVGALLGQQTRTATARVTLKNPDAAWRPGLFVSVDVVVDGAQAAVTVAPDAIQSIENQDVVFIAVPGGFVAQPVRLGRRSADRVEIVEGITAGVQYVSANAFVLKAELGKSSAEHAH